MISTRYNSSGENIKREVLNIVSPLKIMYYYIKLPFNTLISSPFRDDHNPSFIYGDKYGGGYKDFSTGESGDWVNLVQKYYKIKYNKELNYIEAINKVIEDLQLNLKKSPNTYKNLLLGVESKKASKIIKVRTSKWNSKNLSYWFDYGISLSTLNKYKVYPITHYFINGKCFVCDLSYVYNIDNKPKILNTTKKREFKWITNITNNQTLEGYCQLPKEGELLIVTKALKDVMVLYELGYNSIAPIRENVTINIDTLRLLNLRFKEIIFLMDSDQVGFLKMEEYYTLGYKYIFIPFKEKDISDLVKEKGIIIAKEILQWLLKKH